MSSDWRQFWRWFFHLPNPGPVIGFTRALRLELDRLPPGQSLQVTAADGAEFTVMHADDFEHIIRLAGLRARKATA